MWNSILSCDVLRCIVMFFVFVELGWAWPLRDTSGLWITSLTPLLYYIGMIWLMLHTFRFHQFPLMKICDSISLSPRKPILCFTSIILYSCSMNCEDESSLCLCTRNPWRLFSKIFAKQCCCFLGRILLISYTATICVWPSLECTIFIQQ